MHFVRLGHRESHRSGRAAPLALALLFTVLCISWVLWSGLYKPLLLGLGLFSCLLSTYMASRMGFFRYKQNLLVALPRLPGYWLWLLKEVIVSSVEVARVILRPTMMIKPITVTLKAEELDDMGKVILGNSITLSPGTVTVDVHEGRLLIHCLTEDGARALLAGEPTQRALRLSGA